MKSSQAFFANRSFVFSLKLIPNFLPREIVHQFFFFFLLELIYSTYFPIVFIIFNHFLRTKKIKK